MPSDADEQLFSHVLNNKNHVLQSHLPDRPRSQYNLRTITCSKELTTKMSKLNTRDFITRMPY